MSSFEKQCFLGWFMGCVFADYLGYVGSVPWTNLALGNSGALIFTAAFLYFRKGK